MSTQPIEPTPETAYPRPSAVPPPAPGAGMGALALRIGLTLLGAAGLVIGSLLAWFRSIDGTKVAVGSLWDTPGPTNQFLRSAGFVTIVLGLIAIVGLAARSGWLTRLAGALGIAAAVMLVIQVYQAPGSADASDLGIGFWLVVVVAGFPPPHAQIPRRTSAFALRMPRHRTIMLGSARR